MGRDGVNKTALWKKCVVGGNFADARTFPTRHAGCLLPQGLFFTHNHKGDW
jgi:hypothetical protein